MSTPTPGGFDPEELIAQIERDAAAAEERAVQAQRFAEDVVGMRGEATSARGEVRVSVDLGGKLLDLSFGSGADELELGALSRLILTTAAEAHRRAGRRALEHAEGIYGEGAPLTEEMRREFEARIGPLDEPDDSAGRMR